MNFSAIGFLQPFPEQSGDVMFASLSTVTGRHTGSYSLDSCLGNLPTDNSSVMQLQQLFQTYENTHFALKKILFHSLNKLLNKRRTIRPIKPKSSEL